MNQKFLAAVCLVVVCITLSLGLWPFHSPKNEVSWMPKGGLRFGRYGTVIGRANSLAREASNGLGGSIEIWALPDRRNSATILALYRPEKRLLVTLNQSITDLEVAAEIDDHSNQNKRWHFFAGEAFAPALKQKRPQFITVTSGADGTKVYLNGILIETASGAFIPADVFDSRLIIGDSPRQPNSFSGEIRGFAIYDSELAEEQVVKHYRSWATHGRPGFERQARALYLFNERGGNVAHNELSTGDDLYIPPRYLVLDKSLLEPIWTEFSWSGGFWSGNLKNIIGFMPLGFICFAFFLRMKPLRRAATLTLICGIFASLTIETFQWTLPTRDSGTTDIVTNAIGTWFGVLCYDHLYPRIVRRLPGLGWFAPPTQFREGSLESNLKFPTNC